MLRQDPTDLLAHFLLSQRFVRYSETYRHQLQCDHASSAVFTILIIHLVQFVQEGDIGVEPDANAVDEQDWKTGL